MDYLKDQIVTYIGNKRKMLSQISNSIKEIDIKGFKFLDLFSGTGVVSRLAKTCGASEIVSNDLEDYCYVLNYCFLRNEEGDKNLYNEALNRIKELKAAGDNGSWWVSKYYSPLDDNNVLPGERCFYTQDNAQTIDAAMQYIFSDECDPSLMNLLLGSLIYEASVHVNTSGIFKGFHKNEHGVGQFGGRKKNALDRILGKIELNFPVYCDVKTKNVIERMDASELIARGDEYDIAYFDPPYNQHPYGSNYFMLNAIAKGECPQNISKISGIPSDWNRSVYNKREEGVKVLLKNINDINSKYVILSYSSEAFLGIKEMVAELAKIGLIMKLEEVNYNVYRGCRNICNRGKKLQEYIVTLRK